MGRKKPPPFFYFGGRKEGGRGIALPLPFLNLDAALDEVNTAQRPFEWIHVLTGPLPGQSPLQVIRGVILGNACDFGGAVDLEEWFVLY